MNPQIPLAFATSRLPSRSRSTHLAVFGADDGIRTRDPHLGKVMLYQLSHVRLARAIVAPGAGPSGPVLSGALGRLYELVEAVAQQVA